MYVYKQVAKERRNIHETHKFLTREIPDLVGSYTIHNKVMNKDFSFYDDTSPILKIYPNY